MSDFPLISVVVANYNGREHLKDCFRSLRRLDYPREKLELILVDNASTDGSIDFMAKHFPEVRVIRNQSNVGFAKGSNIGAEAARGEYIAFLNNDTRVDEGWARELVWPVLHDEGIVCTASKIVDWEGEAVDFVKGVMNFYGYGHQKDHGRKDIGGESAEPILFACGGSMLMDREVFLEVGGFDEDYFMYFEDVDLGWRLWLMGYQVILVPTAITYHRHHATANRFFDYRKETVLYERNALYTIIKNYSQEVLNKVLPVALFLAARRMMAYMEMDGIDFTTYRFTSAQTLISGVESVSKLSLAPLVALNAVMDNFPALMRKRERIQERRRRSDAEIFALFGQPFHPVSPLTAENVASQHTLAQAFGVAQLFEGLRRRVLVVSSEPWPDGDHASGDQEGQLWRLCRALERRGHEILLAVPGQGRSEWSVPAWEGQPLMDLLGPLSPDIVVARGADALRELDGCPFPLVFYPPTDDGTRPTPLEHLADLSLDGTVEEIIEPLDQFCRLPSMSMRRKPSAPKGRQVHQKSLRELFGEAWYHFRRGGIWTLLNETRGFLQRGGIRVLLNETRNSLARSLRR